MNKLEVQHLSKEFEGIKAVDDLSFDLETGLVTALVGPNGAGKTTVFNILTGFVKPDSGHFYFNGKRMTDFQPYAIARLGIARTFQNIRLIHQMSVLENMLLALKYDKADGLAAALFRRSEIRNKESKNRNEAMRLLSLVGLEKKADDMAENLSHGQRRLLELARALALEPLLILLDEPVAGLFPSGAARMKELIKELRDDGKTVLFVEHDMNMVMDVSDRVIVLNYGKKIAEGTPAEIMNDTAVIRAYLGTKRKRTEALGMSRFVETR